MTTSLLDYWTEQLRDLPSTLELPIENTTTAVDHTAGRVALALGERLTASLDEVARADGASLGEVLLGAYATLLYRYAKQDDLGIGVLGADGDAVVLRANLAGTPPFCELVVRLREAMAAAAAERVPFGELVDALGASRTDGRHPLFQVAFLWEGGGGGDDDVTTTPYDLALVVRRTPDGLAGSLDYNAARYARDAIERLLGHYQVLLESVVADSGVWIDELPMLSTSEHQQIVVDWNQTARPYPSDRCLHELVDAQVDRTPGAIAVVLEREQLTYAELERRANQLAHHLIALGAGPEVRIGLFVERSIEMVVAVLAILKAGAAYVPLETKSPQDRIAFILEDASAPILITQDRLVARLGDLATRMVRIDADWPAIAQRPVHRPVSGVRSDNLAYVIYTSGSTGRPKGVLIEHRMIVNLVTASGAVQEIVPGDRMLQFSSVAFDSSVEELFTPLTHGATMVLRGEDVPGPADLFGERFAGMTVMNIPTAYWHALAASLKVSGALAPSPSLRMVNFGGERALPDHMRIWNQLAPGCALNNQYGPTETTVMATAWRLRPEQLHPGREVPIGVPLPNYTVYLLDPRGQPVPVGLPGEIYIGGAGVARGYLDRPELTE